MEKYLSANNIKIPVLSEDSKEFVRYLEDKDVDEEFIHELKHDNIKVVYIDKSLKKLAYQTKEMLYITEVNTVYTVRLASNITYVRLYRDDIWIKMLFTLIKPVTAATA